MRGFIACTACRRSSTVRRRIIWAVDEYVTIDDLFAVFYVHAMTAFDFLSRDA